MAIAAHPAQPASDGLRETDLPGLARLARGKVRDVYAVGDNRLLIVATDRLSAFDSVLPSLIPDRGKVLTRLSAFWFQHMAHLIPHHLLSVDVADFPATVQGHAAELADRTMLVRRTQRIDVECVARGYLAGSAWSEYRQHGTACGSALPSGLVESQVLAEPIFTPATKAAEGHDENISFEQLAEIVGRPLAEQLRDTTLTIYREAKDYAHNRGIIIADTKMEYGLLPVEQARAAGITGPTLRNEQDGAEGVLLLIDELLTPDSSRFWDAQSYRTGESPASFDKQFVRDWLSSSGWNKQPPAPPLPPEIVAQTRARYVEALHLLAGQTLAASGAATVGGAGAAR